MHNPPHPGELVRKEWLAPLGLSVTAAARALGVTRKALSELVNGRSGITAEMAIRLSKAFGNQPETWLGMQVEYDLWRAWKRASHFKVKRLYPGGRKQSLFGSHPGSVRIRASVDLIRPVLDEAMDAETGREVQR